MAFPINCIGKATLLLLEFMHECKINEDMVGTEHTSKLLNEQNSYNATESIHPVILFQFNRTEPNLCQIKG